MGDPWATYVTHGSALYTSARSLGNPLATHGPVLYTQEIPMSEPWVTTHGRSIGPCATPINQRETHG